MKKQLSFLLVSLSLTVAGATAATTAQNSDYVVRLPAYQVEAARQTAAERSLDQGLTEFATEAAKPQPVWYTPELPSARISRNAEGASVAASHELKSAATRS